MATYRYTATDTNGKQVAGQVDASSSDRARAELERDGLTVRELSPIDEGATAENQVALSPEEAEQVVGHVAQLSAADLPLAEGLHAAAQESDNPRVAAALHSIAEQTLQGHSLEEVLASTENMFPPHIAGLVLAAARTGELGDVLSELVEHQRAARALRWSILAAFAYPLLVTCLAVVVLLLIIGFVVGIYDQMMKEFALELPLMTRVLFWWRSTGVWLVGGLVAAAILAGVIARITMGRAGWLRLMATVPIVGPLCHWPAMAEWAGLMSVLIKHQIPLSQALRLASGGVGNANIEQLSLRLADSAAQGQTVSQVMSTEPQFPGSLIPLIRWGEESGMLADAFATGREMFEQRTRARAQLIQSTLPPVLFVAIGCSVLFVAGALFVPLGGLIHSLN